MLRCIGAGKNEEGILGLEMLVGCGLIVVGRVVFKYSVRNEGNWVVGK